MLDTSAFSNILYKILGYLSSYVFLIWGLMVVGFYILIDQKLLSDGLLLLLLLWTFPFAWYVTKVYSSKNVFVVKNKIQLYFIKNKNRWSVIGKEIQSFKRSTYLTRGHFGKYGEKTYALPMEEGNIPFAFVGNSGVVVWLELDSSFPHIVIDSMANKRFVPALLMKNLPTQTIKLEGNFPDYFRVYYEPDQQNITLRVLTPDRMAALIDTLHTFNIEVQGNYLRLYVDHAQHSADDFRKFLVAIELLRTSFKVERLSQTRI